MVRVLSPVHRTAETPAWDLVGFGVESAPIVARPHGKDVRIPDRRAIVRTDRWEVLAVVGEDHRLLPYRDFFSPLHDAAVAHYGCPARVDTTVGREGAVARVVWTLREPMGAVDDRDWIIPQVVAVTSLDASHAASVSWAAVRKRDGCSVRTDLGETARHVGNVDPVGMLNALPSATDALGYMRHVWGRASRLPMTPGELARYLREDTAMGPRTAAEVAELMADRPDNVWEAVAAVSRHAQRLEVRADRRLLEREEQVHRIAADLPAIGP